ncbi:MAG: dUTP diphosphatase [Bacilli bacterium]|nr:dUTP diphosphatase [Bacilli bacterium]
MRKFEKISFEQFKKDIKDDKELYESYLLPTRSTKRSAGYDIRSLEEYTLKPGESKAFTTGLKVSMNEDEVLYLYSRSSMGYKYNVTLSNSVGVIDSDFYNNPDNEGHFRVKLINHGNKNFEVKIGDRIAQGVFMKYLIVDEEEEIKNDRIGGIGSTNKEEK